MTYYDCRFLGVETEWTQASGLKIEKSNLTGAYHQQNVQQKNSGKATAQLATGKIAVNGKTITNSKEQYPLLVYRDVTYFPLTWRFAVDEFGWKYSYDNKNGLVIDAGNVKTSSVTLKDARQNRGIYDNSDFIIDKNYLYYQGENGSVYRRPLAALSDDKQRKQMAEIPYENLYLEGYPRADFYEERGHVYMQYHLGGATMGSDLLYRIDGDTVSENLIQKQYDIVSDFGDLQVQIPRSVIGGINPAKIIVKTAQGSREVGEVGKIYNLVANGYRKEKNELYVLAADWEQETGTQGDSYLYRLNLYTDTFQKVYHEPVEDCVYDGADYYISGRTYSIRYGMAQPYIVRIRIPICYPCLTCLPVRKSRWRRSTGIRQSLNMAFIIKRLPQKSLSSGINKLARRKQSMPDLRSSSSIIKTAISLLILRKYQKIPIS